MTKDLFSEMRQKAQDRIKKQLFDEANKEDGGTNDLLKRLGDEIAKTCECTVSYGPIKAEDSATRKLLTDYSKKGIYVPEGDWYEMKDLVRLTIIAPDSGRLERVGAMIRSRCVASVGMGIVKDQQTFGHTDPCGYSGLNFVVRLTNGHMGEIQANIPAIMYGKMKPSEFKNVVGDEEYSKLKYRFRIDGNRGHGLYEVWRSSGCNSVRQRRVAMISKMYYNYLRGFPDPRVCEELKRELEPIVRANRSLFRD